MSQKTRALAGGLLLALVGVFSLANYSPARDMPPAKAAIPRLLDLGATKCIPCKKMAVILEELKNELAGKLEVEFIDVWVNPEGGKKYGINTIPTQIFYDASGKELSRHEGFMAKEDILARFKKHGIDLFPEKTPAKNH